MKLNLSLKFKKKQDQMIPGKIGARIDGKLHPVEVKNRERETSASNHEIRKEKGERKKTLLETIFSSFGYQALKKKMRRCQGSEHGL